MKPIAICQNKKIFDHYTSWTPKYIECCRKNKLPYKMLDCYQNDMIDKLYDYGALI